MAITEIITPTTPHKTIASLFSLSKIPLSLTKPQLTISESMMQETIENATIIISKWNTTNSSLEKFTSHFKENRTEAEQFINSVESLRRAMHFLAVHHSSSGHFIAANNLMKVAMLRLEKEFYYILSANRDCLSPESVSDCSSRPSRSLSFSISEEEERDDVSKVEQALTDLKMISESMIRAGYSKECCKIYRVIRQSIVDEELYRIGIRSWNQSQIVRLDHEALQIQVSRWIRAAKAAVRSIFRGEKLMCDYVFSVSETINQTCFAHTTMKGAMNLLRFPELVAKCKRSPEKIFMVMSLFETVSDLCPEIESIFSHESLSPIILQAISSIEKLSESAQTILSEFVSSIQKNSSKTPFPGGGIHPLTYKVMDYVALLADNAGILSDILADDTAANNIAAAQSPFPEYFSEIPDSGVAHRLAWIILFLLCKLDSKAKIYSDIGLTYLFLANNLQFIVHRIGATALKLLLGENWLSKLQKKVRLYAANYESVTWTKALAYLPTAEAEAESSAAAIKEHFRKFNAAFEAAYKKQIAWSVPDPKLRDEIKLSIARKVVPAYRRFYENGYVAILSEERNLEILVRYSPDNLSNHLSDLFQKTVERANESPLSPR